MSFVEGGKRDVTEVVVTSLECCCRIGLVCKCKTRGCEGSSDGVLHIWSGLWRDFKVYRGSLQMCNIMPYRSKGQRLLPSLQIQVLSRYWEDDASLSTIVQNGVCRQGLAAISQQDRDNLQVDTSCGTGVCQIDAI